MILLKCRRKGGDLLAFGPDSRALAARGETGLQVWRDYTAKPALFPEVRGTAGIQFTPDGESLVFDGAMAGTIHIPSGGCRLFPEPDGYRYFSMTPDGTRLIATVLPRDRRKSFIACWKLRDAFDKKPLWKVHLKSHFAGRPDITSDDRFIIDELVEKNAPRRLVRHVVRSTETGRVEGGTKALDWFSERSAVAPDGSWLAGQHTSKLLIWNLLDLKQPPVERTTGSRKNFTDVAAHPSGRWLAASGTDGTVKFFETATWSVARTYTWGIGKMVGVAFSPDGLLAAAGSDAGRIAIWDVE